MNIFATGAESVNRSLDGCRLPRRSRPGSFGLTDRRGSQEFAANSRPDAPGSVVDDRMRLASGESACRDPLGKSCCGCWWWSFPWLLVRAGRRRDLAFLAVVWGILCASAQVLANPAGERHEAVIACGVLLALDLGAWFMPEAIEVKMLKLARSKAAKLLIVSLGLCAGSRGDRRARLPPADRFACAQVSSGDPDGLARRA